ncbi:hypothetical protein PANDA_013199 [Ailuropoda melanoleuca]|uniref:SET domain-containing protein n=1 Tax=Ailuropoda melanoleuca TaxID=9646 RepID=D2HND8_AILME|nr:hypothetical protein PANDA_013199 [Ailuropoda melanoleuca]
MAGLGHTVQPPSGDAQHPGYRIEDFSAPTKRHHRAWYRTASSLVPFRSSSGSWIVYLSLSGIGKGCKGVTKEGGARTVLCSQRGPSMSLVSAVAGPNDFLYSLWSINSDQRLSQRVLPSLWESKTGCCSSQVICNAFTICNAEMQEVGVGLYPSMSLLNHSCDPNCSIVFNGPHLLLRAVRDIEAGEEDPCAQYTGVSVNEMENYVFCSRPSSDFKASKKGGPRLFAAALVQELRANCLLKDGVAASVQLSKEVNLEVFGSFIGSTLHLDFIAHRGAPSSSMCSLGCESRNIGSPREDCRVLRIEKALTLCLLMHLLPGPQTTPGYFLHVKANTEVLSTVCDKRTSVTEKRKVEKCEGTRGPSQRGGQFVYFKQGVQLTICYLDMLMTSEERRKQLRDQYCFECDCFRCQTQDKVSVSGGIYYGAHIRTWLDSRAVLFQGGRRPFREAVICMQRQPPAVTLPPWRLQTGNLVSLASIDNAAPWIGDGAPPSVVPLTYAPHTPPAAPKSSHWAPVFSEWLTVSQLWESDLPEGGLRSSVEMDRRHTAPFSVAAVLIERSLTTLWNAGVFLPVVFWSFSPLQHNNDNVLLLVVAFGLLIKKWLRSASIAIMALNKFVLREWLLERWGSLSWTEQQLVQPPPQDTDLQVRASHLCLAAGSGFLFPTHRAREGGGPTGDGGTSQSGAESVLNTSLHTLYPLQPSSCRQAGSRLLGCSRVPPELRALLGEVPSLFGLPHTLGAEKSRLKAEGSSYSRGSDWCLSHLRKVGLKQRGRRKVENEAGGRAGTEGSSLPISIFLVLPVTRLHTLGAPSPDHAVVHPVFKCLWRKHAEVVLTFAVRTSPLTPNGTLLWGRRKHFPVCGRPQMRRDKSWRGERLQLQSNLVSVREAKLNGHWPMLTATVGTESETGVQGDSAARGSGCCVSSPSIWALIWAGLVPSVAPVLLGWIQCSGGSSWLEKAGHPDEGTFALGSASEGGGCKGQEAGARGAGENTGFRNRCILLVGPEISPFYEVDEENNLHKVI